MIKRRKLVELFFVSLMKVATFIVVGSLFYIIITIFIKGLPAINLAMLIQTPKGGYYLGKEGGILNAILGSLLLGISSSLLALMISLPIVFYLNIYLKKASRFALIIRFSFDVLFGIPSIVYGAFGFTLMMFMGIQASLLAAIITVALLILPIMTRSMDEILKTVPFELKEISYALGATKLETSLKVILRQTFPGILTAFLISFGRGISDAASVLFTAGFTDLLPYSLFKPVATLPLAIFFQLATPFPEVQQRGYAAALVLTIIILIVSIGSRISLKKFTRQVLK
ncbi:MAG: phosphate ABC transporter permease [Candidatus Fischerbacteria bacterium RBG_13_37_8]|uniref:Phosphate ABC transporter permease n=1 Tax=Candidatus Fischerbacteria bacterium RBG_13_37_8 TaxID=1817863 RepID=A0A1F5V5M5_9BACT|nr:MAG: phosphate ABC transporter permease [Candidatus Fischerbacteria bacterium RBG_13_37_8]